MISAIKPMMASQAAATASPCLDAPPERIGIKEGWMKFINASTAPVRKLPAILEFIQKLYLGMWATIGIVIILLCLLLVLYLIFRINPRFAWFNHSIDFGSYITRVKDAAYEHCTSIYSSLQDIIGNSGYNVPDNVASAANAVHGDLKKLMSKYADDSFKQEFYYYVSFKESLENLKDSGPARSDIRKNAESKFVNMTTGEISGQKVKEYTENFLTPMNDLSASIVVLSDALGRWGDDTRWASTGEEKGWTTKDANVIAAVHELRMILEESHMSEISRMIQTRRVSSYFTIWTIYFWPEVSIIYTKRIPYKWTKVPYTFTKEFQRFIDGWASLGIMFAGLPCAAAYMDPAERFKKCKTGADLFTQPKANKTTEELETEVVEAFGLGGIVNALKSIGSFFINIGSVGEAVAMLFIQFPVDPFGTIIGLLSILLGTVVGLLLMIVHLILTVLLVPFILGFSWAFFNAITLTILYTIWAVLISFCMAVPYFGLWLIDVPTGGLVTKLMRCENHPDDWYRKNAYFDENGYSRSIPMCKRPCPSRYTYWGGTTSCCCKKMPDYYPDKCPQQHIYSMFKDGSLNKGRGPVSMDRYKPPAGFSSRTVRSKKSALLTVYADKVMYMQKCFDRLSKKDFITQHLCRFFDILDIPEDDRKTLASLCNECMCEYKPKKFEADVTANHYRENTVGGNTRRMCENLRDPPPTEPGLSPGSALFRKVLILVFTLLVVLSTLFVLVKRSGGLMA